MLYLLQYYRKIERNDMTFLLLPISMYTHYRAHLSHSWSLGEQLRFKSTGQFSFASVN